MATFSFFGDVDKNDKGKIGSEYPAWIMGTHVDELREGIQQKERVMKAGLVDAANLPYHKETLNKEVKRLGEITTSKPILTDKQKETVELTYKKIQDEISNSMFTRSEMKLGLADAHEEARRMINPIISTDKDVAKACNVPITGGRVSRNGAIKMYKIMGSFLNAQTNAEYLRKNG